MKRKTRADAVHRVTVSGLDRQAAESLYTLESCLREGKDPSGPVADAAHALHRLADRFPALLLRNRPETNIGATLQAAL